MDIKGFQSFGSNWGVTQANRTANNTPASLPAPGETYTSSQPEWTPQARPTNFAQKVEGVATRTMGQARSLVAALTVTASAALAGCATAAPAAHAPVADNLQQTHTSLEQAHNAGKQIHDTVKPVVQKTVKAAQPYVEKGKEAGKEIGKHAAEAGKEVGRQAKEFGQQTGAFFKGLFGH